MPYSPFTRFLACLLVVLGAIAFLWPDDRMLGWAWRGSAAIAILLALFTWTTVKNSPPLDDRGFQHCLPSGPDRAFFRILWIHLLVLAGVALAVMVYCAIYNFTWRAASWGVVMLTIPAWALISAVGLASSGASSQEHRRSTAWFAIFATPVFSSGLLYLANGGLPRPDWEYVYFTPLRTTVLTAATLYPLCWWLVAARKQWGLGLLLGGATSALLPWLFLRGDFVRAPEEEVLLDRPATSAVERITLKRKPFSGSDANWIPVEDLIEIQGLTEGDYTRVSMAVEFSSDPSRRAQSGDRRSSALNRSLSAALNQEQLNAYEVRETGRGFAGRLNKVRAIAANEGGKIVWGADAVSREIRKQLPPVETFKYMRPLKNKFSPSPVIRNPGAPDLLPSEMPDGTTWFSPVTFYQRINPTTLRSMPWTVSIMNPGSWKLQGSCLATDGTTFRLKEGTMIKVFPLDPRPEGGGALPVLNVRVYQESLWQTDGPWFGREIGPEGVGIDVAVVAIDTTGKFAYLMDEFNNAGSGKVMLGECERMSFSIESDEDEHDNWRSEMLRRSRLYVFTSEAVGFPRKLELPAAK